MKNKLLKFVTLAFTTTLLITGCGGEGSSSNSLKLGTGGTTGTYYTVGGTMVTVLNDILDNTKLNVVSSGASKANIFDVDDGLSDLAIVQNDVMDYAYNGTNAFIEEGSFDSFVAIAGLYDETCQIIASTNITSIADLKGKTINVGDAGSGVEFNATQILAAYGIDINTDVNKVNGSFSDASNSLKDGRIDAAFVTAGSPTTAIVDLSMSKPVALLSIDADKADALIAEYPFYTKTTIPAGTYSGIDSDTSTLSVRATLIGSTDLDEDVVYELTKALFENQSTLAISNAKFEELDIKKAVEGISVPFHAGAERYFVEKGVL